MTHRKGANAYREQTDRRIKCRKTIQGDSAYNAQLF